MEGGGGKEGEEKRGAKRREGEEKERDGRRRKEGRKVRDGRRGREGGGEGEITRAKISPINNY